MANCKECYHYEVCRMHYQQKCELTYETEKEVRRAMLEAEKGSPICDHFKDRSQFVELPCKLGDTVYYFNSAGKIFSQKVSGFIVNYVGILVDSDVMFDSHLMGDRFFSTREEAEQALKERESNA